MSYSLGVDLGTTFVAAAIADPTGVRMVPLGDRSVVAPATVYLEENGTLLTGEPASLRAMGSPDRAGWEITRRLGDPTPVMLGGQPHTVIALLGSMLLDVLHKVIETEGEPPDRVMLTHPASWGPFRRALFEEVQRYAGLKKPPVVTAPEAAAARYVASQQPADGETVAVYDLGGGIFDATVLRTQPGGVEILGTPEGNERLGGIDFDEKILSYVDYAAGGALRELDLEDPRTTVAFARLRQDCSRAKETLSVDNETVLNVVLPDGRLDVRITRSDFEDMVRAPIESTIGALSRTLESAQVKSTDLGEMLLIGGSSRIPLVGQMVSAELGRPTAVDTHPQDAVALGAATLASQAPMPPAGTIFDTGWKQRAVAPPAPTGDPPGTAVETPPDTPTSPAPPERVAPLPPPPGETAVASSNPLPIAPSNPPRAAPKVRARTTARRPRRRRLVLVTAAALIIAAAAITFVMWNRSHTAAAPARLVLTTSQVKIGNSYFAAASGFSARENVRFSWTGPTNGVMDAFPADASGRCSHGPIFERDPPGNYTIIATGLKSGRKASAPLQVLPPDS